MTDKKVAIITAASRGMGAACAKELASRGYTVVLMARSDDVLKLAEELNGVGFKGSVIRENDLKSLVKIALDRFDRIDAVVNNTGHPAKGAILEISDQDWHDGLDLLLLNVVRMARLVTPVMERQKGGALVNISTFAAVEPAARFPVSATLRSALASFAKLFSDRYAASNIRMNNILPGFIDSYAVDDQIKGSIPMQRPGKVSEIAKTAAFLLSPEADYITGQNIRVDGGLTRSIF
jgi:NAD(P)-dependent dehydrogenase (short-subunit alcohol dehydrogenase family)